MSKNTAPIKLAKYEVNREEKHRSRSGSESTSGQRSDRLLKPKETYVVELKPKETYVVETKSAPVVKPAPNTSQTNNKVHIKNATHLYQKLNIPRVKTNFLTFFVLD